MAENMSYLYTIGGYATLFGLGYAAYRVSTNKSNKKATSIAPRSSKTSQVEQRKEDRKKKQRLESFTLEAQEAAKMKTRVQATEPSSRPKSATEDTSDDGVDNREFARQLAKAKEGKKFASKADGSKQKEKSVKQSRANQMSNGFSDEKPSDTGAEADDDQSPTSIESPETFPVDASGVSDMLEPTPTGPSVLRITDMDKKKEKPKTVKAVEKTESKKQRQNRKKAEAAKEARDEAEKQRKVQEEKQRRTARIAEGRAAKDGSKFMATNGTNSWTKGAPNNAESNVNGGVSGLHQPLDTFEEPVKQQPATVKPESSWMNSLPSEEEQMEMLKNDADDWSTVPAKSSKKGKKGSDSGDEKITEIAAQSKPAVAPKKATKAAAAQFGGFSALTDDAAGVEEEEEEEWEV